jgi:VanZ family protein
MKITVSASLPAIRYMNVDSRHVFRFKKLYLHSNNPGKLMLLKIKQFLFYYYKSIIVFLLIFFASTIPANEVEKVSWLSIPDLDKLIHLGMYFLLTFVMIYDVKKVKPDQSFKKIILITGVIAISIGGSLEMLQIFLTSTRSGEFLDFIFNTIGSVCAIILWSVIKKTK